MSFQTKTGYLGKRSHGHNDKTTQEIEHSSRKRDQKTASKQHKEDDERTTRGDSVADPGDFSNYPEIQSKTAENLKARGIKGLFPIQQACFQPILNRQDIIARDLTGSGKTLAFSLPTIEYLRKNGHLGKRRVQAIALAPTRELALQVSAEMAKLKNSSGEYEVLTVYGGVPIDTQTNVLRAGVDILVGTTGRVLDHINRGNMNFSDLKSIILDEADQMLNMGFKEDIEKILAAARKECNNQIQISLFSATVPRWVRDVASEYMAKDTKLIDLAMDLSNKTSRTVAHLAVNVPWHNRMQALNAILHKYVKSGKTIVFTATKKDANETVVSDVITMDVDVMHGDISQRKREYTYQRFKDNKFRVLVATDVAARGLDVNDIELVVQLEPPKDTESYIHRSGRTARAGKSGTCITFYNQRSEHLVDKIEDEAGIQLERIDIP